MFFSFDQTVRAVFLDILEVFKISTSKVDYKQNVLLGLHIFLFRIVLTLVFWKIIISIVLESQYMRKERS